MLLTLLFPLTTFSQQKLNLTFFGGIANYSGDLQEKRFTVDQAGGAFGAGLSYELAPKILARGQLTFAKVKAADKFNSSEVLRQRNLSFASNIIDASLVLDYSFFDLAIHKATPYVFLGGNLFRFNPHTTDSLNNKAFLAELGTEGQGLAEYPDRKFYKKIQIGVPFGIGVRIRVTDNAYLGYEIGIRKTFTDYIDDVSKTYVDQDLLLANNRPRAASLAFRSDELKGNNLTYPPGNTVRGGEKYKDWYYFSGITLSIGIMNENGRLFGRRINRGGTDCPRIVL